MKSQPPLISQVAKIWGTKTLEDLRTEAVLKKTGIAFEEVRKKDGKRLFMVMCVTGQKNLAYLSTFLNLIDNGVTEDWNTLSLVEVLLRASSSGLAFEMLRSDGGYPLAVALIAADPCSVLKITGFFNMPEFTRSSRFRHKV